VRIELKNDKQKDGIEAAPIYLRPVDEVTTSLIMEVTEGPAPKGPYHKEPLAMRKVDMLTLLGGHENGLTSNEWRLASQVPKRTFYRRLKTLTADGDIYIEGGRYFVFPANIDVEED
jgi:hypothetical protein